MSLRGRPARPFVARTGPSYPRLLLAAGALLASSCAIYPDGGINADEPPIAGGIAAPFDAGGPDRDAGQPVIEETSPQGDAQPAGYADAPFVSDPDAPVTTDAPGTTDAPATTDAPTDAADPTDSLSPGGAVALPFDAAVATEAGGD